MRVVALARSKVGKEMHQHQFVEALTRIAAGKYSTIKPVGKALRHRPC